MCGELLIWRRRRKRGAADLVNEAREHWREYQPQWYRALVKSRKLQKALQDAAERMYQELTEREGASNCESAPMTVDRWRRMKLEREMRQAGPEVRRAMEHGRDKPKINLFAYAPLVEPAGLGAGDIRILKMAGVILAMVVLGSVVFLVLRL
jgi:hypothetical protein